MDPHFFRQIDIVQDGDCFMRSLTIYLNKTLQDSKRGRNNQLLDKALRELEQSTMLAMRLMIVNSIEMEKNKYEKEIYYDEVTMTIQAPLENEDNESNKDNVSITQSKV